ncbi:ABC transporter substrate-binding protein [Nitrosopumilus sp.]|uniref:ABC transporter substrate-binding protein n=1 Tax=Nitrosopumilus sp. TaxID=2024843 RepID=UPI00349FED25
MKSTQLLSVVFSLIMFTGVTAGNAAFAESDDLDDILETFCEMTIEERSDIIAKFGLDDYAEKLAIICDIDNDDEREEALESVIDTLSLEAGIEDEADDETYDETDGDDKDRDYVRDDKPYNLDDRLAHFCDMSDEDKRQFFADHPRLAQFSERLANYCGLSDYSRDSKIKDFIRNNITDEDRQKVKEHVKDLMKDHVKDNLTDVDFREKLTQWCVMSDEEKRATAAEYDKTADQVAKADRYCTLVESDRASFIAENIDEFREHMKARMMDKPHADYDRFCALTDAELAAATFDADFVERASKWCEMTPEEREEYKKEHHDVMKDNMHDKMSDVAKDKLKMKLSDKSDRLKAMIMTKHDITDERTDEIRMKYEEKYGDLNEVKSELKMKFQDHMKSVKVKLSDERKASIHDRLAEMKAFKAELREKTSELTDEQKQQLREEFIEKAKDMQLAWISPRTQIAAGVDVAEVECREGFTLVMKASNGVPICLTSDTALRMIDKGIAVPAN